MSWHQPPGEPQPGQRYSAQGNYGEAQFDPSASPMAPETARIWALTAHLAPPVLTLLSAGTLGFLAPLVIWFFVKDRDPLARNAAAGSFNFNVMALVLYVVLWIITLVTLFLAGVVTFPLMGLLWVLSIVFAILGAVRAGRGQAYRYPLQIPVLS